MRRRSAIAVLGLAALAACAPGGRARSVLDMMPPGSRWRSTLQLDHPLAGVIWSVAEGRCVDGPVLAAELHAARYRLLGEVHDNPDHHDMQLTLLRGLAEAGLKPAVAFEQFDREHDTALRQRLAGSNVTADDVASAVNFNHKGWDWTFYRPLVETALRHGMPLRAANLSRAAAQPIIKGGLEILGAERIAALRIEAAWTPRRETVLRRIIFDGHCRALPERVLPAMAAAQRARDATLAAVMLDAGAGGAVLIAGNGHVRRDLGVPLYLRAADTSASICAVGILEVEAGQTDPRSYVDTEASPPPAFDFVCFTPQWSRPDPCAAFKTSARLAHGDRQSLSSTCENRAIETKGERTMRLKPLLLAAFAVALGASPLGVAAQTQIKPSTITNPDRVRPYPPVRIIGNLYYVGTYDLAVYLVTTPAGHMLINTGYGESTGKIRANVEALGFRFGDIKT